MLCPGLHPSRFWATSFGIASSAPIPPCSEGRCSSTKRSAQLSGVMPPRFMFRGADVYLPTIFHRGQLPEGVRYVHLLGRLKPGVTAAKSEADLLPIIADLTQRDTAAFPEKWRVGLLSFKETFPSGIRDVLWILFGAVGLLLL